MTKHSILIVDDIQANLQFLRSTLIEQGYQVYPAINGKLALKAVKKNWPSLILLDINMPDMNGYEVCEHLKADEQTRDIPVIFISALSETFDKVKAFSVGGVDLYNQTVSSGRSISACFYPFGFARDTKTIRWHKMFNCKRVKRN